MKSYATSRQVNVEVEPFVRQRNGGRATVISYNMCSPSLVRMIALKNLFLNRKEGIVTTWGQLEKAVV